MGKMKRGLGAVLLSACFALSGLGVAGLTQISSASAAEAATQEQLNEKLVVKYAMDDTPSILNKKITAYAWDSGTQAFVRNASADATIQYSVNNNYEGKVTSVEGMEGSGALSFTGKAHARASFQLPSDADGMTITMLVKNINYYWSSLIEFWDGTNGGRLGKGTMQGNGGRQNEADPWSSNCSAHTSATMAPGGGWDSFVVKHNNTNNDNGGAAVDPMKADMWYQVTFVITSTEVKAYRDGVLKQTFNKGNSTTIASSIMSAAKSDKGMLGIRLCHDTTYDDADILDDVRIYSGAFSEEEVKASLHPFIAASPEYYEVEGLGYPAEILLDGAASVSDNGGQKTGTTGKGVTYTYTPLTLGVNDTTPENDEKGIEVTYTLNSATRVAKVKFSRTLKLEAESLGYQIGSGAAVALNVPENAGEDIIVKVAKNTDLSNVTAGNIAVKKLDAGSSADKYSAQFTYSASTHTAFVRCSYLGYAQFDTVYTIKFVEKNTDTFTALTITGGKSDTKLSIADFAGNSAEVAVGDLSDFSLQLTLSLAEGAQLKGGGNTKTLTAADLEGGKLSFTVINENGDEVEYFLVPVALSSDAGLSSLTADGYNLSGSGNEYTVTVDKGEVLKLLAAISATPAHAKATVAKAYDAAASKIVITVIAEDGVTVQRYTIAVTELDTDTNLYELLIDGKPLEGFNPATTEYTVKYKGDIPTVSTSAQNAVVGGVADGKAEITVTAENGDTKVYTVTFVRMKSDATLTKLTLNGSEITFTENAATYEAPAGTRLNTLIVTAEVAEGAAASYKLSGNQLIITVTAEDGTTATYTVTVTVAAATLPEGGVTEDNSPSVSGCKSSLSGTAIAGTALILAVGVGMFVKKSRKTH